MTTTTKIFPKVLRYKWEAYCDTDGRSTEVCPFPGSSMAPKALQYKLETYCYGEQKNDKEKSHKGIWWWECPGSVPGINSGRPRDTRDVRADLCGNSHSWGRMSAGQTGQMTGQMGHVHGTDGTQTRGCPAKILYVYWSFFVSQLQYKLEVYPSTF